MITTAARAKPPKAPITPRPAAVSPRTRLALIVVKPTSNKACRAKALRPLSTPIRAVYGP